MDKKILIIGSGRDKTQSSEALLKILSTDEAKYGRCPECGYKLGPVWYEEPEDETLYTFQFGRNKGYTGRYHKAVDYLLCECCGHRECTDGSFDERYYYRKDN